MQGAVAALADLGELTGSAPLSSPVRSRSRMGVPVCCPKVAVVEELEQAGRKVLLVGGRVVSDSLRETEGHRPVTNVGRTLSSLRS